MPEMKPTISQPRTSTRLPIEHHSRPTIMDGEVITYSTAFSEEKGLFGTEHKVSGPFSISISRTCLMVHRCELRTFEDFDAFSDAMMEAKQEFFGRNWR